LGQQELMGCKIKLSAAIFYCLPKLVVGINAKTNVEKSTHQSGWNKWRDGLKITNGACVGSQQEVNGEEHNS
jgi:hypothetical protein